MRTVAIIPAYNEERTIASVVKAVKDTPCIQEVFVINDGSADNTSLAAALAGATVIEMPQNRGKGAALQTGLQSTESDVVVFLDADLVGLMPEHVDALVQPVLRGEVAMTLGVFGKGRAATDLAQKITPFLSGQRAIQRQVFRNLPNMDELGFGVEVALTKYIKTHDIPYCEVIMPEVSQVMKEEKFGFFDGFTRRLRMYWDIVRTLAQ